MGNNDPFDYFTVSRQVAAQYREIYEALMHVGFDADQALKLLIVLMGARLGG